MSGRIADVLALIRADLTEPTQARFYIAGPTTAVSATCAALLSLGVAAEQMTTEETAS